MELIVTQNITLDGVIEQSDETGEWFSVADEGDTTDVRDAMAEMMGQEDAQLYGRKTFEAMRGFWPNQTNDTTGVTDHLNQVEKYVLSSTMEDPEWEHSTVMDGDLRGEVRALKERPGGNLGVTGSISVCHDLIEAGLVDEYRLLVYPVVVGAGRRLFRAGSSGANLGLNLLSATSFESGVVLLAYRPA